MISISNLADKYNTQDLEEKIGEIEHSLFGEGTVVFLCSDLEGEELENKKDEIRRESVNSALLCFEETLRNDGDWNPESSLEYDKLQIKLSDHFENFIEKCFSIEF